MEWASYSFQFTRKNTAVRKGVDQQEKGFDGFYVFHHPHQTILLAGGKIPSFLELHYPLDGLVTRLGTRL